VAQVYDADSRLSQLDRPAIRLGGRLYVGRLLSLEEWEPFELRMEQLKESTMTQPEVRRFLCEYSDAVFARRYWWQVWQRSPTQRLMRSPTAVQVEAFTNFFVAQRRSMMTKKQGQMSGSSLPPQAASRS
jgi:hypothetical protein